MWNACREWTQGLQKLLKLFSEKQAMPYADFVVDQLPHEIKQLHLTDGTPVLIRLATQEDALTIFQLEENAYQGKAPWQAEAFLEDLRYNPKAIYLMMSQKNEPIAFIGSRVTTEAIHITNIAVHVDFRFLGCATLLMKRLEKYARFLGKERLSLEVCSSNTKAIRLYQKFGFKMSGYKENYYTATKEDAIEMSYSLPPKTPSSFNSAEFSFGRLAATPVIASQLVQLVQENYEHPGSWQENSFLQDLSYETSAYYGVYHLGHLIGFVALQIVLDEATITNIVIQQEFQGKGLAQRVWQMACYDLLQKGVNHIFLEVREFNVRAQQLYEILGFERYGRRRDYYQNPLEDALLYRMQLKNDEEGSDRK